MIGLSPMDGITDAAFRFITDKYGHPDIIFTEFISARGINRHIKRLFPAIIHHKTKTPTVAQVFGADPEEIYKAFFIIAAMGFDGLDINMGCPDKSVTKNGGGAALILQPQLARRIILAAKKARDEWQLIYPGRSRRTISVKTRIGYDKPNTKEWIGQLLDVRPDFISLHGRTFRQLYSGAADWDEIKKAADLTRKLKLKLYGNGDIKSLKDAEEKIKTYRLDGVLIGRAALGNPWVFNDHVPTKAERFKAMIEHCEKFMELTPDLYFPSLRKHLAWYCRGFAGAAEMRNRLMKVENINDVKLIINH